MARESDIPGIKQIIQPLEEAGTLVRRTNEEVCSPPALSDFYVRGLLILIICSFLINSSLCINQRAKTDLSEWHYLFWN